MCAPVMTTPQVYTDRITFLEARKTALEGAIQAVAEGGITVTIEGRTLVRPDIGSLNAELNRVKGELRQLKMRVVGESTALPTIRLTRGT